MRLDILSAGFKELTFMNSQVLCTHGGRDVMSLFSGSGRWIREGAHREPGHRRLLRCVRGGRRRTLGAVRIHQVGADSEVDLHREQLIETGHLCRV